MNILHKSKDRLSSKQDMKRNGSFRLLELVFGSELIEMMQNADIDEVTFMMYTDLIFYELYRSNFA